MENQEYYLHQLGIARWRLRTPATTEVPTLPSWKELQHCVVSCTACGLHKTRTQTVFGSGNPQASLMFIGEAPGAEEDRQGKPFVGRAGLLLTEMLRAINMTRDSVFIANILKCRPPNNRDPLPEEVQQCTPFLQQQIKQIQPKLLVALGRISAHYLLNTKTALSRLRGELFYYGENNTPLLITYHPAYLLRSPQDKSKAYEDLCHIQNTLKKLTQGENTK